MQDLNLFIRSTKNPILKPNKNHTWENFKLYNPGIIFYKNQYFMLYRAVNKGKNWQSFIGLAVSKNGINFKRFNKPVLKPEQAYEKRGLEDPRITKINKTFYCTYAAYDGTTPRLCMASSKDLKLWHKHGPILQNFNFSKYGGIYTKWDKVGKAKITKQNHEWSKAGGLFPKKINNKYWLLFGEHRIWLASSKDLKLWHVYKRPFLSPRQNNFFDSAYVEMGPPPILTKLGWLILYHGIDKNIFYRLGFLLLDKNNPKKILYRSQIPIFGPAMDYEFTGIIDILPGGIKKFNSLNSDDLYKTLINTHRIGAMPKVIFCCGAILKENNLQIYYGAGDSVICTAKTKIQKILNLIK